MPLYSNGPLDFTNGDTFQRITVTNDRVGPSTPILVGTLRADITSDNDPGYVYAATVTSRSQGSFDVNVAAFVNGDPVGEDDTPPNEQIELVYFIS